MKSLYTKSCLVLYSVVQFVFDFEYPLTWYDFFYFTSSLSALSHDPLFKKFSISELADNFLASFSLPYSASWIDASVSGSDMIDVLNINSCALLISVDILGCLTLFYGVKKFGFNIFCSSHYIPEYGFCFCGCDCGYVFSSMLSSVLFDSISGSLPPK